MNIIDKFKRMTFCYDCVRCDLNNGATFCSVTGKHLTDPKSTRCGRGVWFFDNGRKPQLLSLVDWVRVLRTDPSSITVLPRDYWPEWVEP